MIKTVNRVTCDVCGIVKEAGEGKIPVEMNGAIEINENVFYENRTTKKEEVCMDCMKKIVAFIDSLAKEDDE